MSTATATNKATVKTRAVKPWYSVIALGFMGLLGLAAAAVPNPQQRRSERRRPTAEELMRAAEEEAAREAREAQAHRERAAA